MVEIAEGDRPSRYFDFVRVHVGEPRWDAIRRLRYDVYCTEMRFLDALQYPDGLEDDEFDKHSVHFAALDAEQNVIATLRLVRDQGLGFPLEQHGDALDPTFSDLLRDRTIEISRLVLASQYRRRAHDTRYGIAVESETTARGTDVAGRQYRRSRYPLILFGLFRCMFEESVDTGLEYWVAAMEPWLRTFLARFGFVFTALGPPMQYFGTVVPYGARIADMYETVATMRPEVLDVVLGRST